MRSGTACGRKTSGRGGSVKVLALECSTEQAGAALLSDGSLAASRPVETGRRRSQGLFDAVEALLRDAGWAWEDVEAIATGRGPGSYMGLRVSLTAAQGWALPGGKTVWAVSSAAALAAEWLEEHPDETKAVASGAARRGMIWAGCFERAGGLAVRRIGEWRLLPAEERAAAWPDAPWIESGRVPRAEWVGRLLAAGVPGEELQPIYLNPAVAIAPRFDATGRPL